MIDEDPIADALNIEPIKEEIQPPPVKEIKTGNTYPISSTFDERKRDYQMVRDNLKHIIETSSVAIDGILNVASEGESPRAYEVVSQLIKTTLEANESLVNLHKKIKDIEHISESKPGDSANITNNSIYVGSTKELLDMIRKNKNQDQEIIDHQ